MTTNTETTTYPALRKTLAYLREHGWSQGILQDSNGEVCLVGAFVLANAPREMVELGTRTVYEGEDAVTFYMFYELHPEGRELENYIAKLTKHVYESREDEPADATIAFNDKIATSEKEIYTLLEEFLDG